MSAEQAHAIYGQLLLTEQGEIIYSDVHATKYGAYMYRLLRLRNKGVKESSPLYQSYLRSAESARFFATYPADLSKSTVHDLARLRKEFNACANSKNTLNSDTSPTNEPDGKEEPL